ncbi:MAG TPA: CotH kinase family protein, partial [Clostridia bacterium]|nr:CotH kinase family protein [Clostridia bacterium]
PTPGTWNGSAGSLTVPVVSFHPAPGVWASNTLAVTLASDSSSAVIRYTLDGTVPNASSPIYTNTIQLTANTTLRAQAELSGVVGEVASGNYVLLDAGLTNFSSNLPLIIVDTLGKTILDGTKVAACAVFIGTNTPNGRTSLRSQPEYLGRLGIELHGFSSLNFPKKPFSIELWDETDDDLDHALFGMPAHSDWLLYASYNDKTLMNNVLTQEIFESMGHYAIRRRYVELFLRRTPGRLSAADYQGVYVLLERIRIDNNRVDIPSLDPSDITAPDVTGGYLFERDRPEASDLTFTTLTGQQLIILDPKPNEITIEQYNYLRDYVNAFEAALYGPNWRDPLTGYAAYIDADSFVDFHWMVEYPKNIDGVRLSNHLYKDREGKIKDEPIWDWDLSWGNANYAEGGKTNGWYYPLMSEPDDMWLRKLRNDPDFHQKIVDRWGVLRQGVFNPSNLFTRINQITNYLGEALGREFERWPRLGTFVWPNPNGAVDGWDVDYVSPTTYDGMIAQFKKYINGRFQWIDQQFLRAPTLTTNGALLTLSAPVGTVYFTLDGTDPRASGGAISPAARLYSGPVTLTNNAGIFARAFDGNAWSPAARAVYVKLMPSLRITEINYHPAAAPANSPYSEEDFEFIEIQNTGTNVLNLAGAQISGGIQFLFAPSQMVAAGAPTTNSFEGSGSPFVASRLGQLPGPYLTNGPAGNMLGLLNSGTTTARNRVAFEQTAPGNYDRLIADFDFRASTLAGASVSRPATLQSFDATGTGYTLAGTAPAVLAADAGSSGSFLRLVPATESQSGRVGFDRTATGTAGTVVATFDFRITAPPGQTPADGFGFALLNTSTHSTT